MHTYFSFLLPWIAASSFPYPGFMGKNGLYISTCLNTYSNTNFTPYRQKAGVSCPQPLGVRSLHLQGQYLLITILCVYVLLHKQDAKHYAPLQPDTDINVILDFWLVLWALDGRSAPSHAFGDKPNPLQPDEQCKVSIRRCSEDL